MWRHRIWREDMVAPVCRRSCGKIEPRKCSVVKFGPAIHAITARVRCSSSCGLQGAEPLGHCHLPVNRTVPAAVPLTVTGVDNLIGEPCGPNVLLPLVTPKSKTKGIKAFPGKQQFRMV